MKNQIISQSIPSELSCPWYDLTLQVINNSSVAYIEVLVEDEWKNNRLDLEFKQTSLRTNERAKHYSFCEIYGFSKENIAKRFAQTAINNFWVLPNTIGGVIENFLCWCEALEENWNSPSFITTLYPKY